eukprot:14717863-Alexandrium_andersonii.AAC.1
MLRPNFKQARAESLREGTLTLMAIPLSTARRLPWNTSESMRKPTESSPGERYPITCLKCLGQFFVGAKPCRSG